MKRLLVGLSVISSLVLTSCSKENISKPHSLVDITWSGTLYIDTVATPFLAYGCPGQKVIKGYKHTLNYNHGLPDSIAQTYQEAEAGKIEYWKDSLQQLAPYKYAQFTYKYETPIDTTFRN